MIIKEMNWDNGVYVCFPESDAYLTDVQLTLKYSKIFYSYQRSVPAEIRQNVELISIDESGNLEFKLNTKICMCCYEEKEITEYKIGQNKKVCLCDSCKSRMTIDSFVRVCHFV